MRTKIALAGLGLGLAAAFAPLSSASAVCIDAWWQLTGKCSPCHSLQEIIDVTCVE